MSIWETFGQIVHTLFRQNCFCLCVLRVLCGLESAAQYVYTSGLNVKVVLKTHCCAEFMDEIYKKPYMVPFNQMWKVLKRGIKSDLEECM